MEHKRYLFLLLLLFFSQKIVPQQLPDERLHKIFAEGVSAMANGDYEKSLNSFQILSSEYNNLPLGKIMLAANEIFYSYDYQVPYNEKKILRLLEEAEEHSNRLLKNERKNKWNRYYLSLAEGYKTLYEGLTKDWLNMISDGISCISNYNSILEIDPAFYEAYIAIGAFKFWRSENIKYLQWLPFINDEREEGIRLLKLSVNQNSYHDFLGMDVLFWINMRRGETEKARMIAEESLRKYPDNRLFKMNLARYYETTDRRKAIRLYEEVLNAYERNKPLNRINEVTIKTKIAISYFELGEVKKVVEITQPILKIKDFSKHESLSLAGRLERLSKLNTDAKAAVSKK